METKTETKTAPVVVQMPEQNGVRQPRPGTACAIIWDMATDLSSELQSAVSAHDLQAKAEAAGFNAATIKTQYARWRKYHGVEGRVESSAARDKRDAAIKAKADKIAALEAGKAAKAQAKLDKAAERQAAKDAKEAEKAAKAAAKEADKKAKAEAKAEADAQAKAAAAAKAAEKAADSAE